MNPNPYNRGEEPVKPINRVVTPIRVDEAGNKIVEAPKEEMVLTPPEVQNEPTETKDPSSFLFVLILLIILAIVVAFIFYVIVPRFEKGKTLQYNDATSETTTQAYSISSISINQNIDVLSTGTFQVDDVFTIKTNTQNNGIGLYINDVFVTNTKKLLSTVGRVDDLLLVTLEDDSVRASRLLALDEKGEKVYELSSIEGMDGMKLLPSKSSVIFNSSSIVVLASRMNEKNLFLDNESEEYIQICDTDALEKRGVPEQFVVLGTFTLTYDGNHTFSRPKSINPVTLSEYKTTNHYCE